MKYNAVAFLEALFQHPGGTAAGDGPPVCADALPSWSVYPAVTVADLPADWHLLWDERAAIMEYDGGLPRECAEALALADILEQMRRAASALHNDACN